VSISDPFWQRANTWLEGDDPDPDLVVIGVPSSSASLSPSEAWRTPPLVRQALARFSVFDSETRTDLRDLAVADRGDWPVTAIDMHEMLEVATGFASGLDPIPVHAFFGGDNAITRPIVRGLHSLDDAAVLTFDAHHDVRTTEPGPTNGSPIRGLVEDGLPDGRVTQIGIHSFANSAEYREYCDDHGIEVITMDVVDENDVGWLVRSALDDLSARVSRIHVDVDMDVLDTAYAPGCPGSRPGGMTPRQLMTACRSAGAHPAVTSVDFVEVDPSRDRDGMTIMNTASAFLAFASGLVQRKAS
jgi:arginase family enzyme